MANIFEGVQFVKSRSVNDFLLSSARFSVPADLDKWSKRAQQNLLYYQTNYFQVAIVLFLLIAYCSPGQFLIGLISFGATMAGFIYATNKREEVRSIKGNHPVIFVVSIILVGWLLVYLLDAVAVFLISITLPLVVIFAHASLRLRNLENKIENKLESAGVKRTYMGLFLSYLDIINESIFD